MTKEDKMLIVDYMGWSKYPPSSQFKFDANVASLCVQEMQKRGDWQDFVQITSKIHKLGFHSEVIAWLFNAENFFAAMAQWLKEGK